MIDPRLHTLRSLRDHGTVTAAAAALHLTPSTVSLQLRRLAADVGLVLLRPDGRRVRITPAGYALLAHADRLAAQWQRAEAELAAHRDGTAGRLRFTGIATAIPTLIAPAARKLERRFPGVHCEIGEDPGADRCRMVLDRVADIAVVIPTPDSPPPDDTRFTQRRLLTEPQDLLVAADDPLAGRDMLELAELAERAWLRAGDPVDQHALLELSCAAAGFSPRVTHNAVDWAAVAGLVANGFGICLTPRLADLPPGHGVVRVPVRDAPTRTLVACVRKGSERNPPIDAALAALASGAEAT